MKDQAQVVPAHFDPYRLSSEHIQEPPEGVGNILRRIGPGLVLSAAIVGSGELIATTTLGAKVGYVMLWLIIFSCLVKSIVQAVLGRYVITTGETTLVAFARMPGPRLVMHWFIQRVQTRCGTRSLLALIRSSVRTAFRSTLGRRRQACGSLPWDTSA